MGRTLSWGLGSWRNEVQGPVPAPGECTFIHSVSPSCIHSWGHSFTHTQGPTYEPQDYLRATLTRTSIPPFSCCPILGHSAHPSQPHDPTLPASGLTAEGGWGRAGKPTEGSAHTQEPVRPQVPNGPQKDALPPSPPCRYFTPPGHPESLVGGGRALLLHKPSYDGPQEAEAGLLGLSFGSSISFGWPSLHYWAPLRLLLYLQIRNNWLLVHALRGCLQTRDPLKLGIAASASLEP